MKIVAPHTARNAFARLMLSRNDAEARMGEIELREHQKDGVARVMDALGQYGGALLCDEVGLGKTFTAAGVIKRIGKAVVIAPAALAAMWRASLDRARVCAQVISLEKFSRTEIQRTDAVLVIIDEAHHLRNSHTARFRNIASYIGSANVLLLSATPLHNHRTDLTALLSLFLGSRAASLGPMDESNCVIRRRRVSLALHDIPSRVHCAAVTPPVCDEIRRLLLALPPPVPPRDGGECAALVQFSLLRQWVSSDAALACGLQARIARAHALISALESGTFPTQKEIAVWITAEGDVQLGFAELLASPGGSADLLQAVRGHKSAAEHLLRFLKSIPSTDHWRVRQLRTLRTLYGDRKIVAFTQFASTARELYKLIKADGKVAMVTSGRCEIVSGVISRQEVIRRFAPRATGCIAPPEREAITLLIATDICSEGLNLQDAGVVVHLDLPWTAARIEQRIGRVARTGSVHREIFVHSFRVPAIAEDLLRIEQRVRAKRLLGERVIGVSDEAGEKMSVPDAHDHIRLLLNAWHGEMAIDADESVMAYVRSELTCFVAIIGDALHRELICEIEDGISADPRDVLRCLGNLSDESLQAERPDSSAAEARVNAWLSQRRLETQLEVLDRSLTTRRRMSRRIHQATNQTPLHQRAGAALLADQARRALLGFHNAGNEAQMLDLATHDHRDRDWLQTLVKIAEADGNRKTEPERSGFRLLALLVGQPR